MGLNTFKDCLSNSGLSDVDIKDIKYNKKTKSLLFCLEADKIIFPDIRDKIGNDIKSSLEFIDNVHLECKVSDKYFENLEIEDRNIEENAEENANNEVFAQKSVDDNNTHENMFERSHKAKKIEDNNQLLKDKLDIYLSIIIWNAKKTCSLLNGSLHEMYYKLEDGQIVFYISDKFAIDRLKEKNWEISISNMLENEIGIKEKVILKCDKNAEYESVEYFEKQKIERINDEIKKNEKLNASVTNTIDKNANNRNANNSNGKYSSYKQKNSYNAAGENEIYKRRITREIVEIKGNLEEETIVCFEGKVFEKNTVDTKNGKKIFTFSITDNTYSIACKLFLSVKEWEVLNEKICVDGVYKVEGLLRYDTFAKDIVMNVRNINEGTPKEKRVDNAQVKRVELSAHTNMSDMNGIAPVSELVNQAKEWGHSAIAITDFGGVQAFPDAAKAAGDKIKIIYGMVAYLYNDEGIIIDNPNDKDLSQPVVVFDIETTGLSFKYDKITEIGAVKVQNGSVVDTYNALVNPEMPIPMEIVELTGITDDMVANKPTIDIVFPEFIKFISDCPLVAHNASFDISFIKAEAQRQKIEFNPVVVDTLLLSRLLIPNKKRHRLNQVAKYLGISLENHHRAVDDATATAKIYIRFLSMLKDLGINDMAGINNLASENFDYKNVWPHPVTILVKNQQGLKDLYKLVSHSNTKTFYQTPRLAKSLLQQNRQNFLLGSATQNGDLYDAILSNKNDEEIEQIIKFYDYIEIQPIENNMFLINSGRVKSKQELQSINMQIIQLADKYDKPVVATGDVHFINPEDVIYRKIIKSGKGNSRGADESPLYFRTTDEMLSSFSYLGDELAKRVVVDATNEIAKQIDVLFPVPKQTFPPRIKGSDEQLREMCFSKAKLIYGDDLPKIVEERLSKELDSIIKNGYAVMYIIAQKLVTKSLEDGYLVGSRGSVGSSFAATMSNITEVNPLPPHYICSKCKKSEFVTDGEVASGFDLPDKNCPNCNVPYVKEGHNIPFATFLGFDGDKEPDIDLNFASVYQATSHQYTEELFGEGYVYKAGTISTIADKTAFGLVKKYFEENGQEDVSLLEVKRLAKGCTGIKRTSGQHPGGIMVIPDYKDVYDFTPIQYPANDLECGVLTTHFDYHSLSGRILKLDILGHEAPSIIRDLEDITDVNIKDVPLDDKDTLKLFTSAEPLKMLDDEYKLDIGSLGIPEFGTQFVRQMLAETQPKTFSDLVRISGLSHGELVWVGNAQDLVRENTVEIKDVISARDDIMVYLIYKGLNPKKAFDIMEKVRKGKGLSEEHEALMKEHNVPKWYIWSCKQIKYMFPKAHAVAYVMMSFRVAYFKVHYPLAFYSTYFSTKVSDFDAQLICQGKNVVYEKLKDLKLKSTKEGLNKKETDLYSILEIVAEMYSRGYHFLKVDLYSSHSHKFKIVDGAILPPFQSLQGVGESAAKGLAKLKDMGEILSIEDMQTKAKLNKTVIEALREHGCLEGLSESNQLTLF